MKNRIPFLNEHIEHFAKVNEQEHITLKISKLEYKIMAETLFASGLNLMTSLQADMYDYVSTYDFLLVELVRLNFTKAELIKWALKVPSKEHRYKLHVGLGRHLCDVLQNMPANIYEQSLLGKIHKQLIDYGFSDKTLQSVSLQNT